MDVPSTPYLQHSHPGLKDKGKKPPQNPKEPTWVTGSLTHPARSTPILLSVLACVRGDVRSDT